MSEIKRMPTPWSYSQAVEAGGFVFLGIHRGSGDTFDEQFHGTFAYLKETMDKLNLPLESIVKVNVWLKDINDLPAMDKLFYDYFDEGKFPARMTSTTEFIDADCLMMIDGVAYREAGA